MTKDRIRGYCPRCGHDQIFEKGHIHHGVHLFLAVITLGIWLVSWASIYFYHQLRPWRCQQCGWNKPLPRSSRESTTTTLAEQSRSEG